MLEVLREELKRDRENASNDMEDVLSFVPKLIKLALLPMEQAMSDVMLALAGSPQLCDSVKDISERR